MNYVEPIRDLKKLQRIKKLLLKDGKVKELVLFEIGIKTGLRISDILKLTWRDIYSELGENPTFRQSIMITEKKTGKSKQFRLSDSVKESVNQLAELENFQEADFIFMSDSNSVSATKSAWTRQYVWQFLNDYGYRSGIKEKIGTHTIRKTFGYHVIRTVLIFHC